MNPRSWRNPAHRDPCLPGKRSSGAGTLTSSRPGTWRTAKEASELRGHNCRPGLERHEACMLSASSPASSGLLVAASAEVWDLLTSKFRSAQRGRAALLGSMRAPRICSQASLPSSRKTNQAHMVEAALGKTTEIGPFARWELNTPCIHC